MHRLLRTRRAAVAVATSLALSLPTVAALTATASASASGAPSPAPDTTAILDALTPAQRQSLAAASTLQTPAEASVAKGINLKTNAVVDVIVTLRQPVASTAVALSALDGTSLSRSTASKSVRASQRRFAEFLDDESLAQANGQGVKRSWTQSLNAVRLQLPGRQVRSLVDSPDVAGVWPNATVTVGDPVESNNDVTMGGTTFEEVRALQATGLDGEGVKVGVLDTGIDYNHPSLEAVYAGGYDLVDDDADPMETTYADWQACGCARSKGGSTYYTSHGTHVAGIIAGQDPYGSGKAFGVAPGAEIHSYRVLGPYGGGTTEDILSGMEHALADGMDVVNMSLGASVNDPRNPLAVAADNMTLADVIMVIAAGNDGPDAQTLGTPGAGALPITVGANDSDLTLPTLPATIGAASATTQLMAQPRTDALTALAGQTYDVVDVGDGTSGGYSGKGTITGKVVLIERGGTTLQEMVSYAKARGAVAALVTNNNPDEQAIPFYIGEDPAYAPAFSMAKAAGDDLRAALAGGATQVTFGDLASTVSEGDTLAGFSSRGPANGTTDIKPEVTAPGVSVLSSVPTWDVDVNAPGDYDQAFGRKSGTSMATPFVAALVALMKQDDPDLTPADAKTRLMNTADPLRQDVSVFDGGAGQVDPWQALHASTEAQVQDVVLAADQRGRKNEVDDLTGSLAFGLLSPAERTKDSRTVLLRNESSTRATYEVSVDTTHGAGSQSLAEHGITVSAPRTVQVKGNGSKKLSIALSVPKGTPEGTYGGFVVVEQAGQEPYRLPIGFRVATKGLADIVMVKPFLTTSTGDTFEPTISFGVGVLTPTRTLDVIVVDPSTGKDLGYVGPLDPTFFRDGLIYGPLRWDGVYLPFTGDRDFPISHKSSVLDEGHYRIRVEGRDDVGDVYTKSADIYVDNTAPAVASNLSNVDTVELAVGQSTFDVHGSTIDGEVADMVKAGFDVDQSANRFLQFRQSSGIADETPINADGSFRDDIPLAMQPNQLHRFLAIDAAGNVGARLEVTAIRENQPWVDGQGDEGGVRAGTEATMTFTGNNADQWGTMRMDLYYDSDNTELVAVEPGAGFDAYGTVDPQITYDSPSTGVTRARVTIAFDGDTVYTGDALPLVDVRFKAKNDVWGANTGFAHVSTSVVDDAGRNLPMQRRFDAIPLITNDSELSGDTFVQSMLLPDGSRDPNKDLVAAGEEVSLTAPDGTAYDVELGTDGHFELGGLPLFEDPWQLAVTMPGHTTHFASLDLSTVRKGELAGTLAYVAALNAAGDVNGDEVVDVRDAIAIRDARGTANRAADIDHDGVVDVSDLGWVEANYLLRNSTADEVPEPRTKYRGTTLDDVLASFGG